MKQVARELGVRYVLEGSVRRSGPQVRVSAQLIDAETGNHIWAERYDRALEDVFAVQDEITSASRHGNPCRQSPTPNCGALYESPRRVSARGRLISGAFGTSDKATAADHGRAKQFFNRPSN